MNIFMLLMLIFTSALGSFSGLAADVVGAVAQSPCATLFEATPEKALGILNQTPVSVKSSSEMKGSQKIELFNHVRLELSPQKNLKAIIPIGNKQIERAHEPRYAGFIHFDSTVSGIYMIVANAGLWIEVIDPTTLKALDSDHHQMSKACAPFHKAVGFELKAGKNYVLQLTGNTAPEADLVILAPKILETKK